MKHQKWIFASALGLFCALSLSAASADLPQSTGKLSHVRIVRLSFVQGDVTIRRTPSDDWAAAMINTPIQEGFSLLTGVDGYAEVEFENGSTARLGEKAQLDFTQLALNAQGDKINALTLARGFATFHFLPQHHDDYAVRVAGVTLKPQGKAEFRADLNDTQLRLEVFDGQVHAEAADKTEQVGKNKVLTCALNSGDSFQLSSGLQKDAWDKWSQARDQQALLASDEQGVSPSTAMFGWDDLGTYGAWGYFPGYGYGWAPYEPVGWMPYSAGMWSYYPGWGYTWISGEPWGWLPFHNGFWNYDPAMGWFWMPGPAGVWGPAMVNWYQGPGWVGWAPLGSGGRSACAVSGAGCITAVNPIVLQNGQRIQPGSPVLIHPANLNGVTHVAQPDVTPGRTAMLSGAPISAAASAGVRAEARPVTGVAGAAFVRSSAPSSVVMGRQVSANEFFGHRGFLSGPQAIHAPLGRTMGGVLPTVASSHGELMPDPAYRGPVGTGLAAGNSFSVRMPTMLTRGSFAQSESGAFVARSGTAAPGSLSSAGSPGAHSHSGGGMAIGAASSGAGSHGGSAGSGHR